MIYIAFILKILYLTLPAAIANLVPPLVRKIPVFNHPIDHGLTFRGKRLSGNNKTYRGFIFGVAAAMVVAYVQKELYPDPFFASYSIIDYSAINIPLFGFLMGLTALLGDAIKSFFKRQQGIESGKSWPLFDQVDWLILPTFVLAAYVDLPALFTAGIFVVMGLVHVAVNCVGHLVGVNETWI
jgi:CDP-2,3-bis-(O-geranylgeranyl)-sn-glycerol synthase